jgi:ATP-dependent RNA helicase DOB1
MAIILSDKVLTKPELEELESQRANMIISDEPTIREYYDLRKQLAQFTTDMQVVISHPDYSLRYLQPGRLIQIKYLEYDFGWGVVVDYKRRKGTEEQTPHQSFVVYVLLKVAEGSSSGTNTHADLPSGVRPPQEGEQSDFEVVPVLLSCVQAFSHVRIYLPKDIKTADSRNSAKRSLDEIHKRFPDGVALLDPIEHMGIKDESFKKLLRVCVFFPADILRFLTNYDLENRSSRITTIRKPSSQLASLT